MSTVFVQFSDATQTALVSVFGGPQDLDAFPNQGEIDVDDPRYLEFVGRGWANYQRTAQDALNRSDITILRCVENGVAVPAAWVSYRNALRSILSAAAGDATAALPERPAFPAGT